MKQLAAIVAAGVVMVGLATATVAPGPALAQQTAPPQPGAPAGDPAPDLTHDQRTLLFDLEDQQQAILKKYQENYVKEVAPLTEKRKKITDEVEKEHPGWKWMDGPTLLGGQLVKDTKPAAAAKDGKK